MGLRSKNFARPGKSLQETLQAFDPARNITNAKVPDLGKVNIPKLFRRQATCWTQVEGPLTRDQYVSSRKKGQKRKADAAYLRDYFLPKVDRLNPKQRVKLADMTGLQGRRFGVPRGHLHPLAR